MDVFNTDNATSVSLVRNGESFPAVVFPNDQVGILSSKEYFPGGGELQVITMVGKLMDGLVVPFHKLIPGKDFRI